MPYNKFKSTDINYICSVSLWCNWFSAKTLSYGCTYSLKNNKKNDSPFKIENESAPLSISFYLS